MISQEALYALQCVVLPQMQQLFECCFDVKAGQEYIGQLSRVQRQLQLENEALRAENVQLRTEAQQLRAASSREAEQLGATVDHAMAQLALMAEQAQRCTDSVANLTADLQRERDENLKLAARNVKLQKRLESKAAEAERLAQDCKRLQTIIVKQEDEHDKLIINNNLLERLKMDVTGLLDRNNDLQKQADAYKAVRTEMDRFKALYRELLARKLAVEDELRRSDKSADIDRLVRELRESHLVVIGQQGDLVRAEEILTQIVAAYGRRDDAAMDRIVTMLKSNLYKRN